MTTLTGVSGLYFISQIAHLSTARSRRFNLSSGHFGACLVIIWSISTVLSRIGLISANWIAARYPGKHFLHDFNSFYVTRIVLSFHDCWQLLQTKPTIFG